MAKIAVRPLGSGERESWDGSLAGLDGSSVFHRWAWLEAAAEHSRWRLIPLAGFLGSEIRFVAPLFLRRVGPVSLLLSPPPGCLIPELGIALSVSATRQDRRDAGIASCLSALADYIDAEFRRACVRLIMPPALLDVRTLLWRGYRATPKYTYHVSLEQPADTLLGLASGKFRTAARQAERSGQAAVTFSQDPRSLKDVLGLAEIRYSEQGLKFPASAEYVNRLHESLPEGTLEAVTATVNGRLVTGLLLVHDPPRLRFWIGGISYSGGPYGLNELLHARVLERYANSEYAYYDLVGANTPQLCRSKARMNGDLVSYFEMESLPVWGGAVLPALQRWRQIAASIRRRTSAER